MEQGKIIAVIPARMAASRFPGKPLAKILGFPMIEHVRRRVELCKSIDEVYVATCDKEIFDTVESYGGGAIMTKDTHDRCTDRVEEAAKDIDAEIVLIFQGDEPLFDPKVADLLLEPFKNDKNLLCTNLLSTIETQEDFNDISVVKTTLDNNNNILYLSRSLIPFLQEKNKTPLYRQTGLSAFRKEFLIKFSNLAPTPLEIAESVDFLRILEHGYGIRGVVFDKQMFGLDEPEHVKRIEEILEKNKEQSEIYEKIRNL
ncbi:MAG: 3-deoxy-manno-octulosonate cytidylyltransferase [Candidatus Zapsychrus exili]|nr:3-deoxy-manno-octulosonate cytidylyltransferase [Candidatus Zapsychrus exili]